jgi:hypothetical protein
VSEIPIIPASVKTINQLDRWIDAEAPRAVGPAARLRMTVAVMDRAAEIGRSRQAQR